MGVCFIWRLTFCADAALLKEEAMMTSSRWTEVFAEELDQPDGRDVKREGVWARSYLDCLANTCQHSVASVESVVRGIGRLAEHTSFEKRCGWFRYIHDIGLEWMGRMKNGEKRRVFSIESRPKFVSSANARSF